MKLGFEGRVVLLVGNGPSLSIRDTRIAGMAHGRGECSVVAISDAAYPFGFADACYSCDAKWWAHHRGLPNFRGRKIRLRILAGNRDMNDPGLPGLEFVTASGTKGFDPRPGYVRTAGNSAHQALNMIAAEKPARVILLGLDMKGDGHWFGDHPEGVRTFPPARQKDQWRRDMAEMWVELRAAGVHVVNATPGSALDCFPHVPLENAL